MAAEHDFTERRGVLRVRSCALQLGAGAWEFARERQGEIAEHWRRRQAENPSLFNGRVLMMRPPAVANHVFNAELVAVDFSGYLFWRDSGFPECGLFDGFGSALIRSQEGHVLLGRQRRGNINGGLVYLPGGFIDARDVGSDGSVDIESSVSRELMEETGLSATELSRVPGFLITVYGRQISIAVEYRSPLSAELLRQKILAAIAAQSDPELVDIVALTSADWARSEELAEYVRVLLPTVFSETL